MLYWSLVTSGNKPLNRWSEMVFSRKSGFPVGFSEAMNRYQLSPQVLLQRSVRIMELKFGLENPAGSLGNRWRFGGKRDLRDAA